jgi:predicted O-methyltransferase YrrM
MEYFFSLKKNIKSKIVIKKNTLPLSLKEYNKLVNLIINTKNKNIQYIYNNHIKIIINYLLEFDIKNNNIIYTKEKLLLNYICNLFDNLKIKENLFIIINTTYDENIIEIIYLLTLLFDEIIVYNGLYILCKIFSPIIKQDEIIKIINKNFSIEPKEQFTDFSLYLQNNIEYNIKKYKILLKNKENNFLELIIPQFKYNNKIPINYIKAMIQYFKKIIIKDKLIKISSNINTKEGEQISNIINKYNYKKCLEIGMAFGISAFYILQNKFVNLISIDPYQKSQWDSNGINLLKEVNFIQRHKLYQDKSYVILPKLLKKYKNNYFDFIFIDGFHTFDYTLIDFFYSNLLLKINGIIIIDDALHNGVNKCIKYIETNYSSFYKKLESIPTSAIFQKINEDKREWNYHKNF